MGYAAFMEAFPAGMNRPIDILRAEIRKLEPSGHAAHVRLMAIQNRPIDIPAFPDPDFLRFPEGSRKKMQPDQKTVVMSSPDHNR